ncbi:hypothetical protein AWH69_04580 [Janibacter melonis]|uniref:Uncharacterized protein n=1 Tax=Janibacter melonis TaxID=262209 RepID=A0A176QH21_9MICO|nr:hypothetical protein [Janibacter melonis]OAB89034.1 hypothetical protein AWH69_04580 [Janibacter melonis]
MRRLAALPLTALITSALVVPLAPAAGATTSAPDAKHRSEVILRAEPMWSGIGERVELSGEVYDRGTYRPLANRAIRIESKPVGTTTWSRLATVESNASGSFRLVRAVDRSRTYRAVYAGNAWYLSDTSGWLVQTARPGTKVGVSASLKADGTGARVNGRLTKLGSNPVVRLQRANVTIEAAKAYSSSFSYAGATKTNSHGNFTWKTSVSPTQCYRYRAIYKGNKTFAPKSTLASWSSCT